MGQAKIEKMNSNRFVPIPFFPRIYPDLPGPFIHVHPTLCPNLLFQKSLDYRLRFLFVQESPILEGKDHGFRMFPVKIFPTKTNPNQEKPSKSGFARPEVLPTQLDATQARRKGVAGDVDGNVNPGLNP